MAFARRDLFRGATWFLTPGPEARPELFERLHGLVGSVGARPVAIDAGVHDRLMALVSHLPHVAGGGARQPGRRHRARGPRGPALGRPVVRRPDPRRRLEPAAVGRHPPRQPRRGARRARARFASTPRRGRGGPARAATATGCCASSATQPSPAPACARPRTRGRPSPRASSSPCPTGPGAISEIATALGHAHINIEDLQPAPGPARRRGRAGAGGRRARRRPRGGAPGGRARVPRSGGLPARPPA